MARPLPECHARPGGPSGRRALRVLALLPADLGLDELVAPDVDAYVALAAALAQNSERRKDIRVRIRVAMKSAPFFDTKAFGPRFGALLEKLHARALGAAYPERASA